MPPADHTLLTAWTTRRDAEAFGELVRRHSGMVHAVCRRIVADPALADDLTQECFLSLATTDTKPARSLAGWLHRVATNRALSALRARRRREPSPAGPTEDTATPDRLAAWREVESHVDAAIAALPDDQRAVVVGHFLEGRSHRELARTLGIGQRTVGYRIERGVDVVREHLRRAGVDVERTALAAWLVALPHEVAPPVVLTALGKIAVAGHGTTAAAAAAVATIGAAKATTVGLAAAALIAVAATIFALREGPPPELPSPSPSQTSPAARVPEPEPAVRDASGPGRVAVPDTEPSRDAASLAKVTGLVRTPDGEPVPAADVVLVELPDGDARRYLAPIELPEDAVHRATSDAQGRFEIARSRAAGPAWVSAFREDMVGRRKEIGVRGGPGPAASGEVVLELEPGRTLRGRVTGPDGAVLADALVTVAQSWSKADWGRGSGIAVTDARGEFALGVDADAVGCTLRVNAARHGQDLFRGVPTDVFAELRWQPRATLRGHVDGMTPEREGTVAVVARGELPDPPVPVFYTGMRPPLDIEATVAADGTYAIDDLQPGIAYEAILVGVKADQEKTHPFVLPGPRLSSGTGDRFTPAPGDVVERDFALAAPIVVTGRVTTATSHRALGEAFVQVTKDGQPLWDGSRHTDADGTFRLRLVAGDGVYTFRATPPHWALDGPPAATVERRLLAGATVELDLEVPEPAVVPFRVVDADGRPVESVRTELSVTTADGKRSSIGDSQRLDAEGRSKFELFAAVAEVRIVVSRFPHGPHAAVALEDLAAGVPVPEQTIALPDGCDVVGVVQNADGTPAAQSIITVVARYADGTKDRFSTSTDRKGAFTAEGAFRAEPATFTVRHSSGARITVEAAPAADGRVDLGTVVVAR